MSAATRRRVSSSTATSSASSAACSCLTALDVLGGRVQGGRDVGQVAEAARHGRPRGQVAGAEAACGVGHPRGPALQEQLRGQVGERESEQRRREGRAAGSGGGRAWDPRKPPPTAARRRRRARRPRRRPRERSPVCASRRRAPPPRRFPWRSFSTVCTSGSSGRRRPTTPRSGGWRATILPRESRTTNVVPRGTSFTAVASAKPRMSMAANITLCGAPAGPGSARRGHEGQGVESADPCRGRRARSRRSSAPCGTSPRATTLTCSMGLASPILVAPQRMVPSGSATPDRAVAVRGAGHRGRAASRSSGDPVARRDSRETAREEGSRRVHEARDVGPHQLRRGEQVLLRVLARLVALLQRDRQRNDDRRRERHQDEQEDAAAESESHGSGAVSLRRRRFASLS